MDKDKRTRKLQIRVSEAEFEALQKRSTRVELGRWMREHCLDVTPTRVRKSQRNLSVDPELLRVLSGVSNNLNQLTRQAHIRGIDDGVELMQTLKRIEHLLGKVTADDR